MKISAYTFVRNGAMLGYPFEQSIQSVLPLVDEYIVVVGKSDDDTLARVKAIDSDKIHIVETVWNEHQKTKGYVYAEQKMIGHFHCTGDWALYLETDEVLHENDLPKLKAAMERHLNDKSVEAISLPYIHFYGNYHTRIDSPAWHRSAPRAIKRSLRVTAPDGLFYLVYDKSNKKGRYPDSVLVDSPVYHYGWARSESEQLEKYRQVNKYWNLIPKETFDYSQVDSKQLHLFTGSHPKVMNIKPVEEPKCFEADRCYQLSRREKKHRLSLFLEKYLPIEFGNTHTRRLIKPAGDLS